MSSTTEVSVSPPTASEPSLLELLARLELPGGDPEARRVVEEALEEAPGR